MSECARLMQSYELTTIRGASGGVGVDESDGFGDVNGEDHQAVRFDHEKRSNSMNNGLRDGNDGKERRGSACRRLGQRSYSSDGCGGGGGDLSEACTSGCQGIVQWSDLAAFAERMKSLRRRSSSIGDAPRKQHADELEFQYRGSHVNDENDCPEELTSSTSPEEAHKYRAYTTNNSSLSQETPLNRLNLNDARDDIRPYSPPTTNMREDGVVLASFPSASQLLDDDDKGGGGCWREWFGSCSVIKIVTGSILLASLVFVLIDSVTNRYAEHAAQKFLLWVREHPFGGFFAFVLVYCLATVFFFPVALLTLGGGFIFAHEFGLFIGVCMGILGVFTGASIGAIIAFNVGRYLLRDWVLKLASRYTTFRAIDKVLGEKGFRILALLHLCPLVPFNALNYIAGTTAVPLHVFILALVAILPGTAVYVFLGASADSLVGSSNSSNSETKTSGSEILLVVVGLVAGVVGIAVSSYYAKKEIAKATAAQEEQQNRGDGATSDENLLA